MVKGYPGPNPFPLQATTVVEEGPFLESYQRWVRSTPTLELEQVRRLLSTVMRFQRTASSGSWQRGVPVFVHGEHGSGKTHAIRAAIGKIAVKNDVELLRTLYVKLGTTNFVDAYRRLMQQFELTELRNIALTFLGSLRHGGPGAEVDLQQDPTALLDLFNGHLVERGLLLEAQAGSLQGVVPDNADFQRALIYLLEPDLQNSAFRWLQGGTVNEPELRRLGISGPLNSVDQCRYCLQVLTFLCARTGRPLVLILDQAEKFLLDPLGAVVVESTSLLHSLVESIPDIGGMLVVASSDEAWAALPADVKQRFGTNDIACPTLQPGQAVEVLGLYILAGLSGASDQYRAPWPYTDAAMEKLLRNSGGNLRALLQLAWQSFDAAPADADAIDAVAIPSDMLVLDRDAVQMELRRVLWRLGPLVTDPSPGFHYAVSLPGSSRLLVRLTEALFLLGEVDRAEEDVLMRVRAEASTEDSVADRYVLVAIGYASAEMRRVLRQVYDAVLVYRDADSIARDLQELLGQRPVPQALTRAHLDQVLDELAKLGWTRAQHAGRIEHSVATLDEQYGDQRSRRRFEELVDRWPEYRSRIVRDIADARHARAAADLDELHNVDRAYRQRSSAVAMATVVVLGVAAVGLVSIWQSLSRAQMIALAGGIVAVSVAVGYTLSALRAGRATAPASMSEAERMARDNISRPRRFSRFARWLARLILLPFRPLLSIAGVRDSSLFPDGLLHPDPYRRYGYALVDESDTVSTLRAALRVERVALIRRTLAVNLGRRLLDASWPEVFSSADRLLPELPYLVQHWRNPYWSDLAPFADRARLLVALANSASGGVRPGRPPRRTETRNPLEFLGPQPATVDGLPATEADPAVLAVIVAHTETGTVGAAYRAGLDHDALLAASHDVRDNDLRSAQALLSPTEGLGAYDYLNLVGEIDQLYLFFTQLAYFRDGGALKP